MSSVCSPLPHTSWSMALSTTRFAVQGIYVPKSQEEGVVQLEVNTFCVHGGPGGRLSGIQARGRGNKPGKTGPGADLYSRQPLFF